MNMRFSITAWSAWAPDRTRPEDWQAWALGRDYTAEPGKPDISAVPAMQRRRMSSLSKMAFSTAFSCAGDVADTCSCIFASRHGELERTVSIINSIVEHKDVSPTDFSLSVHSTALGLFSIFMNNKAASTMVVGGDDTFGSALIEAWLFLARYPAVSVLLVCFDEAVPEPLATLAMPAGTDCSIALLLTSGAAADITVSRQPNAAGIADGSNPCLSFLQFFLSGAQGSSVLTRRSCWRWRRT